MKVLIICYHYYREETYKGGIYPVNRKMLLRQVEAVGKNYRFISQSELVGILKSEPGTHNGNYCLITFDDGLKEQMEAYRLLKSMGIPSVYYVTSGVMKEPKVHEVHKLHHVRTILDDKDIANELESHYGMNDYTFNNEVLEQQYRYDEPLSRKVKYYINFVINADQKAELTDTLFRKIIKDESAYSRSFYMNQDDVRELAENDSLGAHGELHLPLATVREETAKEDIKSCIDYLESVGQKRITSFAYPYGGKTAVPANAAAIFNGTGVEFAVTTIHGLNTDKFINFPERLYLNRVDTNDAPGGKKDSQEFVLQTQA